MKSLLGFLFCLCASLAAAQTYSYDAAGRLSAVTHPNGQVFYYHHDAAGNLLSVDTDLVSPVALPASINARAGSAIDLDLTGRNPMGAHVYKAIGLPAGLRINPATGRITGQLTGKPGTYTVSYSAQAGKKSSATQTFDLIVTGFPSALVGGFDTLLVDDDELPVGRVGLDVAATGTFTGKLLHLDGKDYAFKGVLTVSADGKQGSAVIAITRSAKLPALRLEIAVGDAGNFVVVLRENNIPVADSLEGVRRAVFSKTSPAAWRGLYTLSFPLAAYRSDAPQGVSYASATIADTALLDLRGKTSEGKLLTGSVPSSVNRVYQAYLRPNAGAGSRFAFVLKLQSTAPYSATIGTGSDGIWVKSPAAKDKLYPSGFEPLQLNPRLLSWTPPAKGQSLLTALGLPASGEFGVKIQGNGLDGTRTGTSNVYGLPANLVLSTSGKITKAENVPAVFTASVASGTGLFTGSLEISDEVVTNGKTKIVKRKVLVGGIWEQGATGDLGAGYFLLPPLFSGETTRSGLVDFTLTPPRAKNP